LKEWESNSVDRIKQIGHKTYTTKGNKKIPSFFSIDIQAQDLYDALRCDNMNGQRLNRYTFSLDKKGLHVRVGSELKGMTDINIVSKNGSNTTFNATFEGGLENVVKHYHDTVNLAFFDFSEYNQGVKLSLYLPNDDLVFQSAVDSVVKN